MTRLKSRACAFGLTMVLAALTLVAAPALGCGKPAVNSAGTASSTDSSRPENGPKEESVTLIKPKDVEKAMAGARGKVLVVNLWATWCPPCVEETPELAKFYSTYRDRNVAYLSLSADHPSTMDDKVKPFVVEKKLPFPVKIMDTSDPEEAFKIFSSEGFTGAIPTTYVYNREGKLVKSWTGAITFADLAQVVEPLATPKTSGSDSK